MASQAHERKQRSQQSEEQEQDIQRAALVRQLLLKGEGDGVSTFNGRWGAGEQGAQGPGMEERAGVPSDGGAEGTEGGFGRHLSVNSPQLLPLLCSGVLRFCRWVEA